MWGPSTVPPPKKDITEIKVSGDYRQTQREQEQDCPLKAGASAETGGITQVKGGCGGEVSTGYAEECTPRKLWSCTVHRKCVPAASELLIRVLFFKQTILFPDLIVS